MGLSGLGDLILTCSSPQSRNFSFGVNLGKGLAVHDIHGKTGLAEGAFTAPVLLEMAREKAVDMPIAAAIAAVLAGQMSVDQAIEFDCWRGRCGRRNRRYTTLAAGHCRA